MKTFASIIALVILSALFAPVSVQAQQQANASASVTVTVLPAVGVEVRQQASSLNGTFDITVTDNGKYSLNIINASTSMSSLSKELGTNDSFQLQGSSVGSKQTVQLALLSI